MPHSRELKNKKITSDKHSRGPPGHGVNAKKDGAGAHNWGSSGTNADGSIGVLDKGDPNYDSEEEEGKQ